MALFSSKNDAAFINTVNRELINNIIEQTVILYRSSVGSTETDFYGETPSSKAYDRGISINCLVTKEEQSWDESEFGVDVNQAASFAFLKDMLISANVVVQVGDIINHDNGYWEVNAVVENQYWGGKRPDDPNLDSGESISIVASAHLTRRSKVGIDERSEEQDGRML